MCGIFGFTNSNEVTRLMTPTLAHAMQDRGTDSWGVTDGDFAYHALGKIVDGFEELELDGPVYHTRAASCGAVTLRNAHPFDFAFEGRRVIGVHNGHISNWQALKTKYDRKALEVDSEHIFMHLVEGADLAELGGWGAVVWYEMPEGKPEERIRYFSKFGNADNLHLAKLKMDKSPIIFASTREAILRAARFANVGVDFFYEIKEKTRYFIQQDEDGESQLHFDKVLPWGESVFMGAVARSEHFGYHGGGRNWNVNDATCAHLNCGKRLESPGKMLVCEACMHSLTESYFGDLPFIGASGWEM